MKLTAGDIHDATRTLHDIIHGPADRSIPQVAKFKLARMHDVLERHYVLIESQRNALVMTHGKEMFQTQKDPKTQEDISVSMGWGVAPNSEEFAAYIKDWNALREPEVEVSVKPMTLSMFGEKMENNLTAEEFKGLGPLVVDESEER